MISKLSMQHFTFVFIVPLVCLCNFRITDSPKSHNPIQSMHFIQFLVIMLAGLPIMLALWICHFIMLKIMLI